MTEINYLKDFWEDSKGIVVVLSNNSWTFWYHFPWEPLEKGASLVRLFNEKNKSTLTSSWLVDKESLNSASIQARKKIRPYIEKHFTEKRSDID